MHVKYLKDFSDIELKEIVRLYQEEKLTIFEISRLYKSSEYSVSRALTKMGIKKARSILVDSELKERAISLFKSKKYTIKEIHKITGIIQSTLYDIVRPYKDEEDRKKIRNFRINPEKVEEALRLYKESAKPLREICNLLNISQATLSKYLKMNNVENRSPESAERLEEKERDKVIELYRNSTVTVRELCDLTNISTDTLYNILYSKKEPLRRGRHPIHLTDKKIKEVAALYKNPKLTIPDIRKATGLKAGAIHRCIKLIGEHRKDSKFILHAERRCHNALKLYKENNLTLGEICLKAKISRVTFYNYLKKYNEPLRKRGTLDPMQKEEVMNLCKEDKLPMAEIAAVVGVSTGVIRAYIRNARKKDFLKRNSNEDK